MRAEVPAGGRYQRWGIAAARLAGVATRAALFWAAVGVVLALILSSRAARVAGRQIRDTWRRLGVHGRCVTAMVLIWPAAILAADMGLLPGGLPVTLLTGIAGDVFFAAWWWLWRWRGQRQWRQLAAAKLGEASEVTAPMGAVGGHSGLHALEQRVGALEDRMDATEHRGEEREQRVSAIEAGMTLVFSMTGLAPPAPTGGRHRLHLLPGGLAQGKPGKEAPMPQRQRARHRAARLTAG